MKMLLLPTPTSENQRYEYKVLTEMGREAGFEIRTAEPKSNSHITHVVDYNYINERHKADVDKALAEGDVYVVNGMVNITKMGAKELSSIFEGPIEAFAKVVGKELSRNERIIAALFCMDSLRSEKLKALEATDSEIRQACTIITNG